MVFKKVLILDTAATALWLTLDALAQSSCCYWLASDNAVTSVFILVCTNKKNRAS